MSSSNSEGCGCIIIGVVILMIFSAIKGCTDKHSSAPVVSQPSTGYVAPSYSSGSSANYSPTVSEPYGTLQSGGRNNSGSELILKNNLSDPAYVKVINNNGQVCATLYLRSNESYKLGVDQGNYQIKYVSGPSNQWRGTTHFFGSYSTFFSGKTSYIGYGKILTLTFVKRYSRNGSGSNLQKISEDEF
jgi:hypothetical protein